MNMGKTNKVARICINEKTADQIINNELAKMENSIKGFEMVSITIVPIYEFDPQWDTLSLNELHEENSDSELIRLPTIMLSGIGWKQFKKLYKETFNEDLGSRFNLRCSSSIERVD